MGANNLQHVNLQAFNIFYVFLRPEIANAPARRHVKTNKSVSRFDKTRSLRQTTKVGPIILFKVEGKTRCKPHLKGCC